MLFKGVEFLQASDRLLYIDAEKDEELVRTIVYHVLAVLKETPPSMTN
jgi:hypothetical protein